MNDPDHAVDMEFNPDVSPECHHLCLIYDDDEQRRKIVSEYLAAGLKRGEIVRYFADTTAPTDVRAWLLEKGIELRDDGSIAQGQIVRNPFYIKPVEFLATFRADP
jgi:hypothetical protein